MVVGCSKAIKIRQLNLFATGHFFSTLPALSCTPRLFGKIGQAGLLLLDREAVVLKIRKIAVRTMHF
jgi:hypothetical protein